MNRIRMLVLAGAALALSLVVTFMAYRLLSDKLKPAEETTNVVVLRQRVALGTKLTQGDIRVTAWPRSVALQGSFHDPAEVVGRGVLIPMETNEPVIESKLAPKNGGAGLMTTIPEGMRGVSVKVNDVIGVAGFVIPGAHVDVILTGQLPNGGMDAAKIILQNVEVLAAGQNIDRDSEGKPVNTQVITLLVSPEDSQKLALVTANGRIHLALRNPLDQQSQPTRAIQTAELYSGIAAPVTAPSVVRTAAVVAQKPTPKPVVAPEPSPAPPVPVVAAPKPEPQTLEVQLIQGTSTQKYKFEVKPVDAKQ